MMRIIRCALALVALVMSQMLIGQVLFAYAAEEVDLLLVLASDVSRSIDHPKFLLQRDGYAAAISSPLVIDAIKSGPNGKIAINFLEWSGYGAQKVVVDWTVIDSLASGRRFGCLRCCGPGLRKRRLPRQRTSTRRARGRFTRHHVCRRLWHGHELELQLPPAGRGSSRGRNRGALGAPPRLRRGAVCRGADSGKTIAFPA